MASEAIESLAAVGGLFGIGGLSIALGTALPAARSQRRRLWTAYAVELGTVAFILLPPYLGLGPAIAAVGVLTAACALELQRALARKIAGWRWVACLVYPGLFAAHLALAEWRWGFGAILFLFGVVEVNDAFAMVIGSSLGHHKLWPRLSPNKTLEGLAGGAACALACGLALGFALPSLSVAARLGCAAAIVLSSLAGDLATSAVKRWVGIKDFGAAIPVAGGVLDVYDSLIFSAPVAFAYLALAGAP
jgi:CDP-diglyceride synthetase